jgi:hypothetical protein
MHAACCPAFLKIVCHTATHYLKLLNSHLPDVIPRTIAAQLSRLTRCDVLTLLHVLDLM